MAFVSQWQFEQHLGLVVQRHAVVVESRVELNENRQHPVLKQTRDVTVAVIGSQHSEQHANAIDDFVLLLREAEQQLASHGWPRVALGECSDTDVAVVLKHRIASTV